MVKWEYLQLLMTTRPVKEGHSRLIVLGKGEQTQIRPGKRLIDVLCELGEQGWELTGTVDLSSVEETKGTHELHLAHSTLLFKRPLETSLLAGLEPDQSPPQR